VASGGLTALLGRSGQVYRDQDVAASDARPLDSIMAGIAL